MAVTSYRSPGTVTEDTSVGTDVITNEANVANTGSPYATVAWTTGTRTSSRIKATNFGFTTSDVPAGSTIDGFEFRYDRREVGVADNLETKEIYIINSSGALETGTNNAVAGEWPTTRATRTVGGATNKMGYAGATDTDVIDADFGVSFRCGTVGTGTTPDGDFGVFQLRIYYTEATGDGVGSAAGTSTASGVMSADADMAGSGAGAATASGVFRADADMAGTAAGAAASAGVLSADADMIGVASGQAVATGGLEADAVMVGSAAGAGTAAAVGEFEGDAEAVGSSAGVAIATAAMEADADMVGAAASLATGAGVGAADADMVGVAAGEAQAMGTLEADADMTGVAEGEAQADAAGDSETDPEATPEPEPEIVTGGGSGGRRRFSPTASNYDYTRFEDRSPLAIARKQDEERQQKIEAERLRVEAEAERMQLITEARERKMLAEIAAHNAQAFTLLMMAA